MDGQYTRIYNGMTFDDVQISSISASNDSGSGNNAIITADKRGARVDFTNTYSKAVDTTEFVVNKRWADRNGAQISAPEGASVEFTLYYKQSDGTLKKVRSIEPGRRPSRICPSRMRTESIMFIR